MKQPKIIELKRIDDTIGKFEIRQWGALDATRYVATYPASLSLSGTKIGSYKMSEDILIDMFKYVSVILNDDIKIALNTRDLIDNHVGDFVTLQALTREMFDFNTGFFTNGNHLNFLTMIIKGVATAIGEIVTETSQKLSDR